MNFINGWTYINSVLDLDGLKFIGYESVRTIFVVIVLKVDLQKERNSSCFQFGRKSDDKLHDAVAHTEFGSDWTRERERECVGHCVGTYFPSDLLSFILLAPTLGRRRN